MKKLIPAIFLLLAACSSAPEKMQDAGPAENPAQWAEYCERNPHDEAC